MNYGRTYIEIDLSAACRNIDQVRNKIPSDTKLLTVVKAEAYGHGAVEISKALESRSDFFGVASVSEGLELRNAGIKIPILVLGYCDEFDIPDAIMHDIRLSVFTMKTAVLISNEAVRLGKTARLHIALDTGMSRIGLYPDDESVDIVAETASLPCVEIEGIFSHFARSDERDLSSAFKQTELFKEFIVKLESRNIEIPIKHISNSAAIMNFDDCFSMVRAGIVTYGLYPSDEVEKDILDLKPVMSWKSHVFYVKNLKKGSRISYGGTYEAERDMIVATIPVGYADGYPRCLSNIGKVIINGRFAPVTGRVCMDFFMVDITDIPDVKEGDTVTLVGCDEDATLSMEEVSLAGHSFNYELPCRITKRVTRVYKMNNEIIKVEKF